MDVKNKLPESYETEEDENGLKTRISYRFNSNHEIVKRTEVIKVIRETRKIKKSVLERRKRLEKNKFVKNDSNTTIVEKQDFFIESPDNSNESSTINISQDALNTFKLKQLQRKLENKYQIKNEKNEKKKYVPPFEKNKLNQKDTQDKYNYYTLKVSNISVNTTEEDLNDLFGYFGKIKNIKILKKNYREEIQIYAFIGFYDKTCAENALIALDKYGYDNLILNVEYSIEKK